MTTEAGALEESTGRPAGSDSREALQTPTVRSAARAAAFAAGPAWAAALGAPLAWSEFLSMPAALRPWLAVGLVATGVVAGVVAWRRATEKLDGGGEARGRPGMGAAGIMCLFAVISAFRKDGAFATVLMLSGPVLGGWVTGRAARLATSACLPHVAPAAAGVVTAGALAGSIFAGHIALVARGSGLFRAAWWSVVYAGLSAFSLYRAHRWLPSDRERISVRAESEPERTRTGEAAPALVLQHIKVAFGPNVVLHGVDLQAGSGEVVALVGGNGAGKSTLLRAAAGLVELSGGRVIVGGEDVSTLRPEDRAATGLAFVSGARPIFPDLTTIENLRVAAYRTHVSPRSFKAATDAVFELVPALARRRNERAGVLSGGEQRLLAVAQSLYRRALVLLADELSLGLDLDARVAVLDLLRLLADEGVAVVTVDHDLPTLLPRTDRAVLLSAGTAREYADPKRLLQERTDLIPATFLASAAR